MKSLIIFVSLLSFNQVFATAYTPILAKVTMGTSYHPQDTTCLVTRGPAVSEQFGFKGLVQNQVWALGQLKNQSLKIFIDKDVVDSVIPDVLTKTPAKIGQGKIRYQYFIINGDQKHLFEAYGFGVRITSRSTVSSTLRNFVDHVCTPQLPVIRW
jgi:hypothetical protein